MTKNISTYYKLSDLKRNWAIDARYETYEQAHSEMLKKQVKQKEQGFTPDNFIIIKVEYETITDTDGSFIKSITTESRV